MTYIQPNPNGSATSANSSPVVIASDQSAVPVSVSSLPLPTSAATSTKQDTGNTSIASVDTKLGEVQASPTANTVLDRLKAIATALAGTLTVGLPSGASTAANQTTGNTSLGSIDTKTPGLGQALAAASTPVVLPAAQISTLTPPAAITGFATETTLGTRLTESDFDTKTGSLTETAPATDTASSGLNGRLQRVAQRITSLIALLPTSLGANGGLKIEGVASGTAVPVSLASVPSHAVTNAGTFATQATEADGAHVTFGSKADAKSTATDTTAITAMSVWKQISASVQAIATSIAGTLAVSGTVTANAGTGTLAVSLATNTPTLATGTNVVGKVGIDQTTIGTTNGVTLVPATLGGLTTYHLVSAATTNATVVKASAGQLYGWYIYNSNAAVRKLVFHDASTTPTAGASVKFTLPIPPTSGANVFGDIGIPFSTGIAITTVTGLADSDATAVALNDLVITLFYK